MIRRRVFFSGVFALLFPYLSMAASHHALSDIEHSVKQAIHSHLISVYGEAKVQEDINVRLSNLDPRLTLAACDEPISVEIKESSYGTQKLSAKVGCPSGARWTIYVPANIDIFQRVAVSTRNLRKGERISNTDFTLKRTNTSNIGSNYLNSAVSLIDKEIKRPIRSGSVIRAQDVREPILVIKGETVVIMAYAGALQVSAEGTALSSGHLGQQIRIQNPRSKRIIDARVTGSGLAEVQIWQ